MLMMKRIKTIIHCNPASVIRNHSGLALIEFAYAMPFLIAIGMAGTETANLAIITLRLNQMAMLAADNAARVRNSIDESDINEVMVGMKFTGTGIKFGAQGRVIISSIERNGSLLTPGYKIGWQRCFGAKNVNSVYGIEGFGAASSAMPFGITQTGLATSEPTGTQPIGGGALIVAEIRYTYKPLVAGVLMQDREIRAVQTFPVRDRAQQTVTNNRSLSDPNRRLCDAAHLSAI
jgi:hypothetical protein